MTHPPWSSLFLLSILIISALAASISSTSHEVALIKWLSERDGTFSKKLEIRRADQKDSSSRFGVFATQNIKRSELLISIPAENYITSDSADGDEGADECSIVWNLLREMRMGDESEFAPYVRYLLAQSPGQLPSTWSDEGKYLLQDVLGARTDEGVGMLPPYNAVYLIEEWSDCVTVGDPFEENAAMLVVQRGWDDILIPVYDMLSHRNGKWLNTEDNSAKEGDGVDITASRDIKEGEEIYMSYNFCTDCGNRALTYGTPQILRDYGFVEEMPQRWNFEGINVAFDLDEQINADGSDSGKLKVSWILNQNELPDSSIDFLGAQLQRLQNLAHSEFEVENEMVPKHEWNVIWKYHQALTVAITHAIEEALGADGVEYEDVCPGGKDTCAVSERYVDFEDEEDELDYEMWTCENDEFFFFHDYNIIGEVSSAYQNLVFYERPEDKDVCLNLDGTVQICSSYRPHYHETVVHFSARYLENVRRVAFVGGGDSMLLHEILKYPNLELVIGLELDQKVTRHSFKHFGSQPHYDDERVEWWYGDATKSLLMLPKEFFGSFDLVLVDLSETVMSMSVTDELDVVEALSLLLKPHGVFVKNELYLEEITKIFDHTIQVFWQQNPVICDQSLIMGSNGIDFFHRNLTDHNIENLWIEPLDIDEHFGIIHDYRKNDHRAKGQCQELDDVPKEEYTPQVKSAGILMVVEAEDTTAPLQPLEKIESDIFAALQKEGLTPLSTVSHSSGDKNAVTVIIMREGYVVVRPWPEHNYCAFDIHLWGGFKNQESVRSALLASVGSSSGSSSSYRIVTGGMFGASTWRYDKENLGPRVTKTCDREARSEVSTSMDQSVIDIVLEESMNLVQNKDSVIAVICGDRTQSCKSLDLLAGVKNVRQVIPLWTCPTIKDNNEYKEDGVAMMFACEKDTLNTLKEHVAQKEKVSAIIVDSSAPISMAKIVYKILSTRRNKKELLMRNIMLMAMMFDETELWRRNFLEKFRKNLVNDPLFRAEILFDSLNSNMEMGVTSSGDPGFFLHLRDVTAKIKNRTGLDMDIQNIYGGLWNFQHDFDPEEFLPEAYDQVSPQQQYSTQRPLGHQTILQLEAKKGQGGYKEGLISTDQVKYALDSTMSMMNFDVKKLEVVTDIGDGCVIVAVMSEGSVIVVWDGNKHVDINLFTFSQNMVVATQFANRFMAKIPKLKLSLRDEQPRGFGRVVNFIEDIYFEEVAN